MAFNYDYNSNIGYDNRGYCVDCGKGCEFHALGRCRYCYEKATKPESKLSVERQIELSEKHTLELLAKKEAMEQFGKEEDFENDDAILFKRVFQPGGKAYTYVAVKTPVCWYITGKDANHGISWQTLVEDHLLHAAEVWHCTEWSQVV